MDEKIGGKRERKRKQERGVPVFFFFGQGENATKSVFYEAGIVRNAHADVETFDIVNLIFPWGAPAQPPYVFPTISAAVSVDSGLPNRSPTVVLKYTERVGSSSFSLPPYLSISRSIYLSFREFLVEFRVDSSLREIRSKSIARHNFLIFNLVIKRGIKTWLK